MAQRKRKVREETTNDRIKTVRKLRKEGLYIKEIMDDGPEYQYCEAIRSSRKRTERKKKGQNRQTIKQRQEAF